MIDCSIDHKPFFLQSILQVKKFITHWEHQCAAVLRSRCSICPTACSLVMVRSVARQRCHINTCLEAPAEGTSGVMFPGVAVFCGDRDDTILNTSLSLYIIFISEALWNKRGGLFWHCLAFLFLFYCSHSLLLSKTQLHGPGEWILEWQRVITVPYQWLTEARVPPACHCPVALSSLAFLQHNAVPLHCCWHQVR